MISDPTDFVVPTLGTQTRAWRYGADAGATLVLVHGFRGDHHGLAGIAARIVELRPELRVIVPDLPGFGETPPVPERAHDIDLYGEWLSVFVTAVAPDGADVLGHSFGTLVVSAAVRAGLSPRRLILINPISAPALEGPQAALTQLAIGYYRAADVLPERAARLLLGNPLIVRLMSEVMAKSGDRDLRQWIHGQHAQYFSAFADSATLLEAFRASVSHTVTEAAAALTMPTLLIAGDRDDITPLAKQLELRRRLRDARLHIVPGVGHLVHYEAVADASGAIVDFLAPLIRSTGRSATKLAATHHHTGERTA